MTQNELLLQQVANTKQIGGTHYKKHILEHWDTVALFDLDYFQGNAWKYLLRWRDKGGIADLEKSKHYIEKYIEVETLRAEGTLTRSLLERAIRELEGIEGIDNDEAEYRKRAKGDDPVGDAMSGYRFKLVDEPPPDSPLEVGDKPDDDIRFTHTAVEEEEDDDPPSDFPNDFVSVATTDGCNHGGADGGDECPVHPYGGCPPRPAAQPASPPARP